MKSSKWNVPLYNEKHNFVYQYGKGVIEMLDPQPGERILDLGCGSGELTAEIAEVAGEVAGFDSSAAMIDTARSRFPHLDFEVKDATNFSYDRPFDAIFSNAVLHWVTDKEPAIQCMYKNLKKGGRIALEFGGKGNVGQIIEKVRAVLHLRGYPQNAGG